MNDVVVCLLAQKSRGLVFNSQFRLRFLFSNININFNLINSERLGSNFFSRYNIDNNYALFQLNQLEIFTESFGPEMNLTQPIQLGKISIAWFQNYYQAAKEYQVK